MTTVSGVEEVGNSTRGVYFQLDDETTILPTNMKTSPYGNKEVRALTNIRVHEAKTEGGGNWPGRRRANRMAGRGPRVKTDSAAFARSAAGRPGDP